MCFTYTCYVPIFIHMQEITVITFSILHHIEGLHIWYITMKYCHFLVSKIKLLKCQEIKAALVKLEK